jgi:pimeloyl-ACP methyl ester carboxylesterase
MTPVSSVTLGSYTKRVSEKLDEMPEGQQAVLGGHSMGGIVITQCAELRPRKIAKLVYLSGFLPRNGESLVEIAQKDTEALVLRNIVQNEKDGSFTIKQGKAKEIFYHDCSEEDTRFAESQPVPQAGAPFNTPVSTTAGRFGKVPRVYIECLQDRAITQRIQKAMYTALPCERIFSLDTSHSPFFSAPEKLAEYLDEA